MNNSISVTVCLEDIANRYPAICRDFTVNFVECTTTSTTTSAPIYFDQELYDQELCPSGWTDGGFGYCYRTIEVDSGVECSGYCYE